VTGAADRAARVILWVAAGYGLFGAIVCVLASAMTGERSLLRTGAGLVVLGAVATVGIASTRQR
jgi:hypothetical protein